MYSHRQVEAKKLQTQSGRRSSKWVLNFVLSQYETWVSTIIIIIIIISSSLSSSSSLKVTFSLEQATKVQRGSRGIALLSALDVMGGERQAPAGLPPGKTRYPLHGRLGGSQSWSGRVWRISPPPIFDPRTVQPAASSYTDWAIQARIIIIITIIIFHNAVMTRNRIALVMVNNELGKNVVWCVLKHYQSTHLHSSREKEESVFMVVGTTIEIRTVHQPDTDKKFYRLSHFIRLILLLLLLSYFFLVRVCVRH
jgi:hypothetical protein